MDQIEKFFRKINRKDRLKIEDILEDLASGKLDNMDMKKVSGTEFYRVRYGRYRIIFKYEEKIIIETIRVKDENTYKNL
jgi:mRNA-degrading endonuclease RelE of RelBE toxin-antitoxin system